MLPGQTHPSGPRLRIAGVPRRAEITQAVRNNDRVMAHWDAQLPGKVLHVPYEGVVADLEGWARRAHALHALR